MMLAADPPAVLVSAPAGKAPDVVVVSREARSDVLASRDTPLALIKGRRAEDALLRQTLFMTSTLTAVRPAAGAGEEVLRWTYQPYLQRQLCFTSITGQFSCAVAVVEELTETATGEAPLTATPDQAAPSQAAPSQAAPSQAAPEPARPGEGPPAQAAPASNPAAEAARIAVADGLQARADALFDDDRRLKLDPMLKAAGVSIRRTRVPARHVRR